MHYLIFVAEKITDLFQPIKKTYDQIIGLKKNLVALDTISRSLKKIEYLRFLTNHLDTELIELTQSFSKSNDKKTTTGEQQSLVENLELTLSSQNAIIEMNELLKEINEEVISKIFQTLGAEYNNLKNKTGDSHRLPRYPAFLSPTQSPLLRNLFPDDQENLSNSRTPGLSPSIQGNE